MVETEEAKLKRICADCLSGTTYLTKNRGTLYYHWYNHPYIDNAWRCGKCERNQSYHKKLPTKEEWRAIRKRRLDTRSCENCGTKTTLKQGEYYIWHRHPRKKNAFWCPKCYQYDYYPRKYKTKEEVNAAHKEWALQNPDHMRINSIKGCVASQKYGKTGNSKPERRMKKALQRIGVDFLGNYPYKYGEIDIFIPDRKIAIFVDGTIWHGDPECFSADDVLPYNRVVKDVWNKDLRNSEYLRSLGYTVLRFWEREISSNIEKCMETILSGLRLLQLDKTADLTPNPRNVRCSAENR
jgi:DNA mismatch endonuclease, patch repair protein